MIGFCSLSIKLDGSVKSILGQNEHHFVSDLLI